MENKKKYAAPNIETISLDNEISLILESDSPFGPDETNYQINSPDFFNMNPYKSNA